MKSENEHSQQQEQPIHASHEHEEHEHCHCHEHHHEHEGHCHDHEENHGHDCCHGHAHNHTEHTHAHFDCGCSCGHEHGHSHSHSEHGECAEHEDSSALKKIIAAAALFAAGMILFHAPLPTIMYAGMNIAQTAAVVLFCGAYILCGKNVILGALKNIFKANIFDEQFLMSVASLGALAIGQIPEAVAVMLFYQIGEYFEDYAVDKSRDSISALMELCPDKATLIDGTEEVTVDAETLKPGDIILVKPGERIPADGIIRKGKSFLDNSMLTGESVPAEVFEGNAVFSGAINTHAPLEITVSRPAQESAAARILALAEQSSERKTRTERFITRFSRIYTPLVCTLALLVAVVPPVVGLLTTGTPSWTQWIYRALMFLVVSCPCALVISVPLTFFGGIGAASRSGILVKGSSAIEGLAGVKTAVFDKTGTLTRGVFTVTEIHSMNPDVLPEDELVALAAHAETYSNHPTATSLKNAHTHTAECTISNVTDAEEISGQGIRVKIAGKTVLAGNSRLMKENAVNGFAEAQTETAGTVVHVAMDGEYCGWIVISDRTKADARQSIFALRRLGIKKIVMLTGDSKAAGTKAAEELGITDVYTELLPEDKVLKVESLLAELSDGRKRPKGTLAFAGDGINDAPVLSRSDVGIAMGALGSDAAIESADVVIMTDEPAKIAEAIKLARRTLSIVHQNIAFSLGVKAAIMVLSAVGITSMWTAVFGDVGVCFLAILNAMRALGKPRRAK